MQRIHPEKQRNSVWNAEDCREKHACHHLMRAIALNFICDNNGPFKLFCDDLRPRNVLVDKATLRITGVIDWELCYAAPAQFSESVPWWLILQQPHEHMDEKAFLADYLEKADVFLRILEQREKARGITSVSDYYGRRGASPSRGLFVVEKG